jgi:hypothetical protein
LGLIENMAAMQTPTLQQAFDAATTTQAKAIVIPFATRHPMAIKESPPGQDSTILHQIVLAGNVLVFRELIKIPGVWFPLDFKDRSGRTLRNVNETAPEGSGKRNMEVYLNFLKEWDDHCELAKNYIHSENEKVWAWLRRNSLHCYTTPPSRKWSIAMQVVFYGNVGLFELLLNMCPQTRGQPPIWEVRGNDGMTLLDVAENDEVRWEHPEMYDFVAAKCGLMLPPAPPKPVENLDYVKGIWDSLPTANILRPVGKCPLSGSHEQLFNCSRDCNHAFSERALSEFLSAAVRNGPFPVRCPICVADGTERGLITRGTIRSLVINEIITQMEGVRLLDQQMRSIKDEASLDLQYSLSKPCPFCATPIAHYKGHGCHHITPGSGCPSCHNHFCYTCLSYRGDGSSWQGCPNEDELFCDEECDCPLCPDCTPGHSCDNCDGPSGECPKCKPVH